MSQSVAPFQHHGAIEQIVGHSLREQQFEEIAKVFGAITFRKEDPKLAKVTEAFVREIGDRGLVHVLTWIGGWFSQAGRAHLEDEMKRYLGPVADDSDQVEVYLMQRVFQEARSADNYSTGVGANEWRRSTLAAAAQMLDRGYNRNFRELRGEMDGRAAAEWEARRRTEHQASAATAQRTTDVHGHQP